MHNTRKDVDKSDIRTTTPPESGEYLRKRDQEIEGILADIDFDAPAIVAARAILDDMEDAVRVLARERDTAVAARERAADELERVALERDQLRGILGDQGAQIAESERILEEARRLRDRLICLEHFAADVAGREDAPADVRAAARAALEAA